MRVLVVGNAGERYFGERYYGVERKLANGFTRNGHCVWFFSDRDAARTGTVFRSSRAGRGVANAHFLKLARTFRPDLIVTAHSSLIATGNFAECRALPHRPRLAQVCVDPLFRAVNPAFLADRAAVMDATFVTTAGPALSRFSRPGHAASFIPNPVDSGIETARGFERSDQPFDVFFAANAAADRPDEDRRVIPRLFAETSELSLDAHGFDGKPPIFGVDYFDRLAQSRMALNLNSDRAEDARERAPAAKLYLYNSDRVAQLTGCGLLTLSLRVNSLMELYDDSEMVFGDGPENLRDEALKLKRDDAARRRIAEAGWRKAHEAFNERLVARYIVEVAFQRPLSHPYAWPTRLW